MAARGGSGSPARPRQVQKDFYVYVDTVVMTVSRRDDLDPRRRLQVLVMRRPGAVEGKWALPGGLVRDGEDLPATAVRKVWEETGIRLREADLLQVGAYGDPRRDSRWRGISVAYLALVPHPDVPQPREHSDDAKFVSYRRLRDSTMLEFDHRTIVRDARRRARRELEDTPIALGFCEQRFTLPELRWVYEAFVLDTVDAANFRRKVDAARGFVVPTDDKPTTTSKPGRPAQYYKAGRATRLDPPIRFRRRPPGS